MIHRLTTPLVALSLISPWALAQTDRFEIASIKSNTTGDLPYTLQSQAGGRFTASNVTLRTLILYGYALESFRLHDGPRWMASDRFDVVARASGEAATQEMRLMVRTLLADRFKLKTHYETHEQPLYELVLARANGQLGPQLKRSVANCNAEIAPGPRTFEPANPCGYFGPAPGVPLSRGALAFRGMTIAAFARSLVPLVRRGVIDRTGLVGVFDADFDATAELPPPPPPPGIPDPIDRQSLTSVFTVLREQLGLKLEPTKGPVEMLVVDSAEHPGVN